MKKLSLPLLVIIGLAISIVMMSSLFVVHQTQHAIVLQFGKYQRSYDTPGLKMKVPFIENVIFYDTRLLHYNLPALEINAGDQKRLVVDLYIRYRIVDKLKFYRTIGQDVRNLEMRLSGLVLDIMQQVIGGIPLSEMLSSKRSIIMNQIKEKVSKAAGGFGISVVDVRIIRADLPRENSEAIFTRMESERIQEAKLFRAEGDELNQGVRAKADRERTILLAEAKKKAEITRGEGEAIATKTYAEAYSQSPEFYEVYRALQAYSNAFKPEDTTVIMSPKESDFMKHFGAISK